MMHMEELAIPRPRSRAPARTGAALPPYERRPTCDSRIQRWRDDALRDHAAFVWSRPGFGSSFGRTGFSRHRGRALITVPELAADALGAYLAEHMNRRFRSTDAGLAEALPSAARLALDCIGNSD